MDLRKLVAATFAAVVAFGPAALAHPSSSSEDGNQVTCAESDVPVEGDPVPGAVTVNHDGAELCNDSDALPLQGRVIVSIESDDAYVGVDGDEDNAAPANGYARVDADGVTCGEGDVESSENEVTLEECIAALLPA